MNAANTSLLGGGGVDGTIHRSGGPQILEECRAIRARQGGCPVGEAVYTGAGRLPAQYVIHTVGPVWNGKASNKVALLSNCYKNSLQLAIDLGLSSIAFPNISTGVYKFPKALAAQTAIQAVKEFIDLAERKIEVTFICFDEENLGLYQKHLQP